jgi:pantoate--beta-alanine ligase
MQTVTEISALRERLGDSRPIAFVPTMGNLHAGHIDLVRVAREAVGKNGIVVVSIFVNRLQFGPAEDFASYPRTLDADLAQCDAAGVDIVFAPSEVELFPTPQTLSVEPSQIQHVLDGAMRPGHFRGVATIVLKLLNIVQPAVAVFGKKDFQQCLVISELVEQLNLPIRLLLAETIRDADGLALSSRNGYLSADERREASRLNRVLRVVVEALQGGRRDFIALEDEAMAQLSRHGWQVDYVSVRRGKDLAAANPTDAGLVVLAAARLGKTRLIDNLEVTLDAPSA